MTLTVVRQPVGKELGGTLHQRIGLIPQEGFVLRELVVLPQVAREPALHHRPEGGTGHVVVGYGFAPQGRVMVGHPSAGSIHVLCRLAARNGQFLNHTEQRFVTLGQVGRLGRPIVHFGIDVDGIAAVPGRDGVLVPDALQVEGLAAGTRTGNHEVAPVLERVAARSGSLRSAKRSMRWSVGKASCSGEDGSFRLTRLKRALKSAVCRSFSWS